jgi:F0F1-type ATP synthase assembly protein I
LAKKKLQWARFISYGNLAFSFGITMIAAVFLGLYGGWWVDRRLGTFPAFMLLGVFLGIGVGFYNLWKELNGLMRKKPEKESELENDEQQE